MKAHILILVLLLASCTTINRSRKDFKESSISINGGVSEKKQWSDEMVFNRFSWFNETTMAYDILLSPLKRDSNFALWMGEDIDKIEKCTSYHILLVYTKFQSRLGTSELIDQIETQGFTTQVVSNFSDNFFAHYNASDWELTNHKLVGLCGKHIQKKSIEVKVPGFKSHKLK